MSATSPGGRSSTAAIRKTPVVWYDLFPGVRTTKNCAKATLVARIANSSQLPVCRSIWLRNGTVAAIATPTTARKYRRAFSGSLLRASLGAPPREIASSRGIAFIMPLRTCFSCRWSPSMPQIESLKVAVSKGIPTLAGRHPPVGVPPFEFPRKGDTR